MAIRLSFNQARSFIECNRKWYYKKVLQLPDDGDKKYADAGTVVHDTLEAFYNENRTSLAGQPAAVAQPFLEKYRSVFDTNWAKYQPRLEKETYWRMVDNGMHASSPDGAPLHLSSCELEIFFPDFVAYIDGVHSFYTSSDPSREGLIIDWKTSSRKAEKDKQYTEQVLAYAWMYWRKFHKLPAACVVYYLKNHNDRLVVIPTMADVMKIDALYKTVEGDMEMLLPFKDEPSKFTRVSATQDAPECYWCPYKTQCSAPDDIETWNLVVQGDCIVIKQHVDEKIHMMLEKHLNYKLKDAYFVAKMVMAKTGKHYDGVVRLWNRGKKQAPIGFIHYVMTVLQQWSEYHGRKTKFILEDNRTPFQHLVGWPEALIDVTLYDYQELAVKEALRAHYGTIEVPTGGGKTMICAELMRRAKGKALFVIDNKDLLWQTKTEYEKYLGLSCGIVGAGEEDWSKHVTLATVQTLTQRIKKKDPTTLAELAKIHVLIADECHLWAAKSYSVLSKSLKNVRYRIGCSGTIMRDDGNEKLIEAYIGSKVYTISPAELREKNVIMMPRVVFLSHSGHVSAEEWKDAYEQLIDDSNRNITVLQAATNMFIKGKKVLIVSRRIKHCRWIFDNLKEAHGDNVWLVIGETEDENRKGHVASFKDAEAGILVGNMSMFNKGMNVPDLDVIINATGNAGDVATIQSLGRVLRCSPGKEQPLFIDFDDRGSFVDEHTAKRKAAFVKRGYPIEPTTLEKL